MVEFKELGSFSVMKYGKMPDKKRITNKGLYPIFSGYRIVGRYDEFNLENPELIVVARGVGGTGDVKMSPAKCFLTNLSIAVMVDESIALKIPVLLFSKNSLRYLDSGSAQSQITISDLQRVTIPIPEMQTQQKIVSLLDSIEGKIATNEQINDNLAA